MNLFVLATFLLKYELLSIIYSYPGPDHMGIYFSPAAGVTLTNWSFENGKILTGPVWKDDRPTYYIFYSHGLSPSSWEFWEDFQCCRDFHVLQISVPVAETETLLKLLTLT